MQLITREELKATLDANDDCKLVMVVGPWEFRARHIPGSLGFPSPRSALAALDCDDQIIHQQPAPLHGQLRSRMGQESLHARNLDSPERGGSHQLNNLSGNYS